MDQVKIGKFLAELRKKAGLTQEALGEKIGVTNKSVSRWETGTYLPDVETFLLLSKLYQVNVSELLCGEYLSDEVFRDKSEEAVTMVANDKKKAVRRLMRTAIALIVCLTLVFLSAFAATFLVSKSKMLKAVRIGTSDHSEKITRGSVTVPDGLPGDDVYRSKDSGIAVRLALNGFSKSPNSENLYTKSNGYFTIRAYYTAEYPCPTSAELQRYFANAGINRLTDQYQFAREYDFGKLSVFSNESDMDMAAGCRRLLDNMEFPNRSLTSVGNYYRLNGKWNGYMVTNGPVDEEKNVWSVILEDRYRLLFIILRDDTLGASPESVAAWLSTMEFVDD